ncbi:trihelix transcription factor ASR3-like [Gastrolobium bilobum]|uniref:trihelix transcription factor ASR3-like n=1 Tax=Gastrolobium bilobum TaxID=150636 RepID=UPI002AB1C20B|nr:trihelix transcription factor ASR3-like [Gastrolobium bilobum]
MSDPSTPLPILPDPHRQHHHLPLTHGGATAPSSSSSINREYRKGNWTLQETLTLITAKKLDDERRMKTSSTSSTTPHEPTTSNSRTSGELRWKWVENYCWSHGCLRSQNQCNDKWDNLLRDYKKVRDYESKSESSNNNNNDFPSYWTINKQQRKEQNLPSNMVFEVYQAISEVYPRKQTQRITTPQPVVTLLTSSPLQTQRPLPPPPPLPLQQQPPPPPPLPPSQPPATSTTPAVSERSESSGTEHSEDDDGSESKRRKVRNLGSSIIRSASVLARAITSCEEKKEKRHRELIEMEQRRLQIEEARNEVHRQGIATLVAAVTNLSGAIQSLISSERHGQR